MSTMQNEGYILSHWNEWNGVGPKPEQLDDSGATYDLGEVPVVYDTETDVTMGAMGTVLSWPRSKVEDPYFPTGTTGADLLG